MRRSASIAGMSLVVLLASSCRTEMLPAGRTDYERSDSGGTDLGGPEASLNTDLASCNPKRTRKIPGQDPITIGDFCDELRVCVVTQKAADLVQTSAPHFLCGQLDPTSSSCPIRCTWSPPSTIDAAAMAEICAVTQLDPIGTIDCIVFL